MHAPAGAALALALALGLTTTAAADEFWVDGAGGSDANDGRTPGTAWRTVTHALGAYAPSGGVDTIHVAPGLYDEPHGESFPLPLAPDLELVGDGGSGVTELAATPGPGRPLAVVVIETCMGCTHSVIGPSTRLEGFTLSGARFGLLVGSDLGPCSPTVADLVLEDNLVGLFCATDFKTGLATLRGRGVLVRGNDVGVDLNGCVLVSLEEGRIEANGGVGVRLDGYEFCWPRLELRRSRVEGNAGDGVVVAPTQFGGGELSLVDSLVARNGGAGVVLDGGQGTPDASVVRSTIAHDAGDGIAMLGGGAVSLELRASILAGHAADLAGPLGGVVATGNLIEDGTLAGTGGNFAADPGFVDPLNGDFRPGTASPAVDAYAPGGAPGTDLNGDPRGADGDLDLLGAHDLGAIERPTLSMRGEPTPGAMLEFEIFAPPAGAAFTLVGRGPALDPPLPTLFGPLFVDPAFASRSGVVVSPPAPTPASWSWTLPTDPALAGRTFTVQAVARSSAAPSGGATTAFVEFTVR